VFDTNIFRQVKTENQRFQGKNMISYIKICCHFFSPLANIFCYIYNQGKDVCNFLFLYIPDISKAHVYLNSWYITWLQNSCNVTWFHMWREKKSIIWNLSSSLFSDLFRSIINLHKHFKYLKKFSNEKFLDIRELDENFLTYYKIPRYIEW
jgi:hypothetical protein